MNRAFFGVSLLLLAVPVVAVAQGINTNVALPVAKGEGIWRSQLRTTVATDDPSGQDRELRAFVLPQTLVYGFTPRLTAFATLPILADRQVDTPSGTMNEDAALGDLKLLGRYTFFIDDYAPLSTKRGAVLAGMKFPTGADRFGTPSFDPILGAVGTWAANRHELDLDTLYTITTERNGVEAGDQLQYDVAYRYRFWPKKFGGRLVQLNGVLELNGRWTGRSRVDGSTESNSGGNVLFLSPGVQFITQRFIVEASVQVPVVQDLNGSQLEKDFVAVFSLRVPFELSLW